MYIIHIITHIITMFLFTEIKTSRRDESEATGIAERDRKKKKRGRGKEISGQKGSSPK